MARIFGTVLILAGCAGFLYKWAEGEKARQRMAGEWIRLFVRWGYALEQEHVRLYDFLSFMKRQMHPCRHFWMRSVYVCAAIRIQADRKSGRIVCRSTKENCRSGRRGWEITYVCRGSILWRKQCRESAMQ